LLDLCVPTLGPERFHQRRGTATLPDNGWINRFSSRPVPDERRFTLIGHSQGGYLSRVYTHLLQDLLRRSELRVPEISRIMLHPTRSRVVLRQCLTHLMYHLASVIKEYRPCGQEPKYTCLLYA
jgi:hypothetical protein